jgi:hypothetical protein
MQDTPSQAQQADKPQTGVVTFPLVARLLALGGAALFALAAWLPWVTFTAAPAGDSGQISSSVRLLLTPGAVGAPPLNSAFGAQGALFVWSALTVLGVPLAALAWMRVSRPIAWLIVVGYGMWLAVTLIFSITSAQYLLQSTTISIQDIAGATESTTVQYLVDGAANRNPQIGLWLSAVALLICLVGLWTLISAARLVAPTLESSTSAARPAAQTPGAGTLTFGLVLWAVGFLWLAWASLDCPSFVLVYATCKGISADGAMTYAISQLGVGSAPGGAPIAIDPRVGEYAISILLAVGALLIGIGVWRRGVSRALCGWATVWLVAAAAFGVLAWFGVNRVVNAPATSGLPSGAWRGESGILFTTVALLICLVGIGLLWFALLFRRTQANAT